MTGLYNYNSKSGPCKDCPDRSSTCHDTCKKYLDWRREFDKNKREVRRRINRYGRY